MDAMADIKEIEAVIERATHVGRHAVADGNDARQREFALHLAGSGERCLVDRLVRLAGDPSPAAEALIIGGHGAGAGDHPMAAFDNEIRVGADERHIAGRPGHQHIGIVVGRFGLIIEETGADDAFGLAGVDTFDVQPFKDADIPLGTEEEYLLRAFGDQLARHVARGDDAIVNAVGYADRTQLLDDLRSNARRVGDQDHGQPFGAGSFERDRGFLVGGDAVVKHAPDIAERNVIKSADIAKAFDPFAHAVLASNKSRADIANRPANYKSDARGFCAAQGSEGERKPQR
ncbi:hypothetical protein RHSP_03316 [Rhizobium freirei PRF 81]|uniref:Uncharacterized protein n=1 Tax=Rhizobium freirei PRF 81 TaxID=363754 RepID=N6V6Z3_9HYPH|nr:hypothetical protein RHSP_03316 [Rhizobium freirei PRF 81]